MSDVNSEKVQQDIQKIKTAIEQGNVTMPEGSDALWPLDFKRLKDKPWTPEDFSYVTLFGFGDRESKDKPESNHNGGFVVGWGVKGFGFGEITFRRKGAKKNTEHGDLEGGKSVCDSEGMSKEFVKAALLKLVETAEFR